MSKNELVAKIEALNEWEAVIEEAKAVVRHRDIQGQWL